MGSTRLHLLFGPVFSPLLVALLLMLSACGGGSSRVFELRSADITNNGTLLASQVFNSFGCTGANISPQLEWSGAPIDTKSFAVTIFDPDAPTGSGFWHWIVYDIPASVAKLDANAGRAGGLPAGAKHGRNDYGTMDFGGACPPVGEKPHRYIVTVHALKVETLGVPADASAALIGFNLSANRLDAATLTATYGRACAPTDTTCSPGGIVPGQTFTLTSADIVDNGTLSMNQVYNAFGCNGANLSPQLAWSGAPATTKSYAATIYDPDAPTGSGFWHWVVYNIPVSVTSLNTGAGRTGGLPAGAIHGRNDYGSFDFGGACPPVGDKPHRYIVTLHALNVDKIDVPATATPALIGFNLNANRVGSATLSATFGR
jgi:Raf kinase inhibitor-like YbhB/YbcL family protein